MKMQNPNGAICEIQSVVQKEGERLCSMCACGYISTDGCNTELQKRAEGSKCEVHLGNRMESDYREHRAMGLHGGRGDETG